MAPFRNPFQRKPPQLNGVSDGSEGNEQLKSPNGRPQLSASRTSSAISIKQKEPDDIKLSVVDDDGIYLPPSPPEKKGFWKRTPTSTTTSSHRSMLSENEPFSISRESFESYRRSFDISARSPVVHPDGRQSFDSRSRQSLDSRTGTTRPSFDGRAGMLRNGSSNLAPPPGEASDVLEEEETFEEVGLNDENQKPHKKRGLFARFGDGSSEHNDENVRPNSSGSHGRFHLPGRKRGQSGQGAELGNMQRQETIQRSETPKASESGIR